MVGQNWCIISNVLNPLAGKIPLTQIYHQVCMQWVILLYCTIFSFLVTNKVTDDFFILSLRNYAQCYYLRRPLSRCDIQFSPAGLMQREYIIFQLVNCPSHPRFTTPQIQWLPKKPGFSLGFPWPKNRHGNDQHRARGVRSNRLMPGLKM